MFKKFKSKSPNYDERAEGVRPSLIILHYTGMKTGQEALERLCDENSKVSAHYFIDEDGLDSLLVPEDKRAWHAGVSSWRKITDVNSHSIGIEIVNPGHEFGYREFTQEQMKTLIDLCLELMQKYDIPQDGVLAHSDIAPERKQDPGELFDWKRLALNGIGLWPEPGEKEYQKAEELFNRDYEVEHLLHNFGYNPLAAYSDVIKAFHRHYYPEIFKEGSPDNLSIESIARLLHLKSLLKIL